MIRRVIRDKCADFSDSVQPGKSYVYVWLDESNIPFYVGSGSGNRATSVAGRKRNAQFMKKVNEYCSVRIVAENICPRFVFEVERETVQFFTKKGFALCQKAYIKDGRHANFIPINQILDRCTPVWQDIANSCFRMKEG